ncbi:protein crumbs homolog 3 [Hyperolius riggenbachi]|uniref:protein crumbs homolog 3 n=1 Tax=Hyperolius riggenbachi TaxID=752182 RepID=UPI0035A30F88
MHSLARRLHIWISPMEPHVFPLLLATVSYLSLVLADNTTVTTPAASQFTESARLAAIIVPSVVGGLIIIGIIVFFVLKVKEKRQTEGTYRPSNEEQAGSRMPPNTALKLPPEERLI